MVYIQEGLVQVGQVQVVLGFVVLGERLVFWRRKLAERCQVRVDVGNVEAVRLVEVTIPGKTTVLLCRHVALHFLHYLSECNCDCAGTLE